MLKFLVFVGRMFANQRVFEGLGVRDLRVFKLVLFGKWMDILLFRYFLL